jgi:hypothetical protein
MPDMFEGFVEEEIVVEEEVIEEEVIVYKEDVPKLTANIESITQFGNLTIRFSENLWTTKDISWVSDALDLTLLAESLPDDFDTE